MTRLAVFWDSTDPRDNAAKIGAFLREEAGDRYWADLYRTCDAGPSGQRSTIRVGRMRYLPDGPYEFQIHARDGDLAGYATRRPFDGPQEWTVWRVKYDGGIRLHGYASTLSLGVDTLLNGDHAATGRHDSQRRSGGTWQRYFPKPYEPGTGGELMSGSAIDSLTQQVVRPGSRLDDLLATYAVLKPQADETAGRLKAVTDAIKAELQAAAPDARQVEVRHAALAQPLRLSYVESWSLDTKRLKAEQPGTYVAYARKGGRWELRGVTG